MNVRINLRNARPTCLISQYVAAEALALSAFLWFSAVLRHVLVWVSQNVGLRASVAANQCVSALNAALIRAEGQPRLVFVRRCGCTLIEVV